MGIYYSCYSLFIIIRKPLGFLKVNLSSVLPIGLDRYQEYNKAEKEIRFLNVVKLIKNFV